MNDLQKELLSYFKENEYAFNPYLLREPLNIDHYTLRRNIQYLAQKGFLEHKGYQTHINKLLPLYQITKKGRKSSKK